MYAVFLLSFLYSKMMQTLLFRETFRNIFNIHLEMVYFHLFQCCISKSMTKPTTIPMNMLRQEGLQSLEFMATHTPWSLLSLVIKQWPKVSAVGHRQQGPVSPLSHIYSVFRIHDTPRLSAGFQATAGECDLRRPLGGHSASRGLTSGLLLSGSACTTSWGGACGEWPPTVRTWEPVSQAQTTKLTQKSGCQVDEIGGWPATALVCWFTLEWLDSLITADIRLKNSFLV